MDRGKQNVIKSNQNVEIIVSGKSANPPPEPIIGIERKTWLKLSSITFQNDPSSWDLHVNDLLSRTSSRM